MAATGTMAVLLPGTALFLGLPYARARRMIEDDHIRTRRVEVGP